MKVLERLLGDKYEELAIADDGVKVGDKPLREYVEADESLKPFIPALFPTNDSGKDRKTETKPTKLPSGSPSGKTGDNKDPVKAYLKRTHTGAKAFARKTSET